MSIIPQLIPIEINSEKKRKDILTNIVRMLTNRKLLDEKHLNKNIEHITSIQSDEMLYSITLDNPTLYYNDQDTSKTFYIKILNQKITGVSKNSIIGDFLYNYKSNPKLIVVNSISNKAREQIVGEYLFSEIFLEKELLMDIVQHISVPKHELLSDTDAKNVLIEYKAKKKNIPKILITDPISRYYNAKNGQIFKITRPSETSCLAPYHRLVKGSSAQ